MEQLRTLGLIDSDGKPIAPHIDRVLLRLMAKLRRRFPMLQDEVAVIDVMEEAARRIVRHEEAAGPLEKLHGYAWSVVRTVAISRMRRGSLRLIQKTLDSHVSAAVLAATPAAVGSADQIERQILMREIRAKLSDDEWDLFIWKINGHPSREIAQYQGRTVTAVDTIFSRVKQRLRNTLG